MKVQKLLAQARSCASREDVVALRIALEAAFATNKKLSQLGTYNQEAYIEAPCEPHVSVEFNRIISSWYITMIRPEIRNDELVVVVVTQYLLDGLGMQSTEWSIAAGLDETVITATADQTINQVAELAIAQALDDHVSLLVKLGITESAALNAAKQSW